MSTFNKLNKNNEAMVNITISCMLNPNNKDFYLGNMTLDKLASLIDYNSEVADCIFSALEIAMPTYLEREKALEQAYYESALLDDIACEFAKHGQHSYYGSICPNCAALGYNPSVKCPNCDYDE